MLLTESQCQVLSSITLENDYSLSGVTTKIHIYKQKWSLVNSCSASTAAVSVHLLRCLLLKVVVIVLYRINVGYVTVFGRRSCKLVVVEYGLLLVDIVLSVLMLMHYVSLLLLGVGRLPI